MDRSSTRHRILAPTTWIPGFMPAASASLKLGIINPSSARQSRVSRGEVLDRVANPLHPLKLLSRMSVRSGGKSRLVIATHCHATSPERNELATERPVSRRPAILNDDHSRSIDIHSDISQPQKQGCKNTTPDLELSPSRPGFESRSPFRPGSSQSRFRSVGTDWKRSVTPSRPSGSHNATVNLSHDKN